MKILMKGKVETVSLDRVKPAHLECEPTTGTNIQRTTPNKQQSSKTTRISSRNPQDPPRPSSANTQTSNRTSVNPFVTSPGDLCDLARLFRYEARRSPGLIA